jgi:hypothetical protein
MEWNMRKFLSTVFLAALTLGFAGCGGSDDAFQTPGGGGASTVSTVTVAASPSEIASDGSTSSTITATALDANNAGVEGATVTFSVSTGGALAVVSGTTDENGRASATLTNNGAAADTDLTVTAAVGTIEGTATVTVVAIERTMTVETDQSQIPSDGATVANITALLRDANNVALEGVTVVFAADSGVITTTQATTDANGIARATLSAGNDPTNRPITVTASAAGADGEVIVNVTGTTLGLVCPTNLVLNNSGTCTVSLTNSAGAAIAGEEVTITSANGNTLSSATLTTDNNGRGTFDVDAVNGGNDTIRVRALGLSKTAAIAISTQDFQISAPANGKKVALGVNQTVTVTWNNNGAPVTGQPVTFAATRGTLVPSTPVNTDGNGQASVSISSVIAGPAIVQASAAGVSAQITINFIATVPSQIAVDPTPAGIPVGGQSTITAKVRDAANNLVEGATVNFQVTTDPTNGSLADASAVTDELGIARTVYTAGATSSPGNGVTISATVSGTSITDSASLTVGGQTVFLSLGTGNLVDTDQGPAIYQVTYTVFAVDTQGAPVVNVPITASVLPVAYGKGFFDGCPGGTNWVANYTTLGSDPNAYKGQALCENEDTDYTGNINSLGVVGGQPVKDYNTNGRLDPGNVAVVAPSSGVTDANGRFDITVTYPRDHAIWTVVELRASTTVQGTESSTSATFTLLGAVSDYACGISPPGGTTSPYGLATTCADPN